MEIRPHRIINRKKTKEIKVGNISVGGSSQISVYRLLNIQSFFLFPFEKITYNWEIHV